MISRYNRIMNFRGLPMHDYVLCYKNYEGRTLFWDGKKFVEYITYARYYTEKGAKMIKRKIENSGRYYKPVEIKHHKEFYTVPCYLPF